MAFVVTNDDVVSTRDFTHKEMVYLRKLIALQMSNDTQHLRRIDRKLSPDMTKDLLKDISTGGVLFAWVARHT